MNVFMGSTQKEIITACCSHFNSSLHIFRENRRIQISIVDNDTVEGNSQRKNLWSLQKV